MKRSILLTALVTLVFVNCSSGDPGKPVSEATQQQPKENRVIYLTNETFKEHIFNYDINQEWKYNGKQPAIIDFYADWCAPCRQISPVIEELANEYHGRIIVYKVDTEKEKLLSQSLGVQALPTVLLIPMEGQPQAIMGALPKADLIKAINEVLL